MLLATNAFSTVKTISKRLPKARSSRLQILEERDILERDSMIFSISQAIKHLQRGGHDKSGSRRNPNQSKIDHALCIENAKAAKEARVKAYLFIFSGGTRGFLFTHMPYSKMKIGVEDIIKALGFRSCGYPEVRYDSRK
jgi:hypothetical protein